MQKTTTPTRKTEVFQLRLSPQDKEVLRMAATRQGRSIARFMLDRSLAAAKSEGDLLAA